MEKTYVLSLSVFKLIRDPKTNTEKRKVLYSCIPTYEEADLLAQYAMSRKEDNEVIAIFPGWNRGVCRNEELREKAMKLAEQYKHEYLQPRR